MKTNNGVRSIAPQNSTQIEAGSMVKNIPKPNEVNKAENWSFSYSFIADFVDECKSVDPKVALSMEGLDTALKLLLQKGYVALEGKTPENGEPKIQRPPSKTERNDYQHLYECLIRGNYPIIDMTLRVRVGDFLEAAKTALERAAEIGGRVYRIEWIESYYGCPICGSKDIRDKGSYDACNDCGARIRNGDD